MQTCTLAVDIGASSGRHIVGTVQNGKITLQEVYRFENGVHRENGHLCWDIDTLAKEVVNGLKAAHDAGFTPATIGIDTWAVDFVLLDADNKRIGDAVAYRDELYDYYEVVFPLPDPRFKYLFLLYADGGRVLKLDGSGLRAGENTFDDISECFAFAYAYPPDPMPDWARGCVGYQIFPDRFRRAGGAEAGLEPWNSTRVQSEHRFGGNLSGIREAIPYLKDLGVTMVYTTPLFLSDSAHRYNTFDYYRIDPLLGTEADLSESIQSVIERAERNEREKYLEMDVDVIFTLHDIRDILDKLIDMETILKELEAVCRKRSEQIITPAWEAKGSL